MFGLPSLLGDIIEKYQDPRTKGWLLVGDLEYPLIIIALYLTFSLKIGPWLMENRKPFELKRAMQAFNILQIIINLYLFFQVIIFMYKLKFDFRCQPFWKDTNPVVMKLALCTWIYYMVKISDVVDTVFFVLRKKNNHISFLHLYHHSAMIFFGYMGATFYPDTGHVLPLGLFNTLIHAIMYTYYFIASLGPEYQKYIWWKKHLTSWQMIQFAIIWIHNFQVLFRECRFPRALNYLALLEASIFLYLFGQFYIKTYNKESKQLNVTTKTENGKLNHEAIIKNGADKKIN